MVVHAGMWCDNVCAASRGTCVDAIANDIRFSSRVLSTPPPTQNLLGGYPHYFLLIQKLNPN